MIKHIDLVESFTSAKIKLFIVGRSKDKVFRAPQIAAPVLN